ITPIQRVRIEADSDGRRPSTRGNTKPLASEQPGRVGCPASPTTNADKETQGARHARPSWSLFHHGESEDLAPARPGGGSGRDARLRLPEAGRAAAERQEGHRRRRHVEEAPPDAVRQAAPERREARHAG